MRTGVIESTLTLQLNTETISYLENTKWWCQVEFTILDDPTVHTVVGDAVALRFGDCKWFRLKVYNVERYYNLIGLLVTENVIMRKNACFNKRW